MRRPHRMLLAGMLLAVLLGCGPAGRDDRVTRDRDISSDIDAVHRRGPTSTDPGQPSRATRDEPVGAIPWQFQDRN